MGNLRNKLSSRTWRHRGAAVAVLVVLAGGWALGVAGMGDDSATDRAGATTPSDSASETPSETPTPEEIDPSELTGSSATPTEATPSQTPAAVGVEPVAESPDGPPETSSPEPSRTRNPDPTPTRGTPTPTPRPSKTPKPTPSETADCADLAEAVDCLLAPITTQP